MSMRSSATIGCMNAESFLVDPAQVGGRSSPVRDLYHWKASTTPMSLKNLKAGSLTTGSLKSPQTKKGRPEEQINGIMLAKRRSFGRLPSLCRLANPYKAITRISSCPIRTMQAEKRWDSFSTMGTSPRNCLEGTRVKIAVPTASPL